MGHSILNLCTEVTYPLQHMKNLEFDVITLGNGLLLNNNGKRKGFKLLYAKLWLSSLSSSKLSVVSHSLF